MLFFEIESIDNYSNAERSASIFCHNTRNTGKMGHLIKN